MKHWWQEQPMTISAIQVPVEQGSKKAFDEYVSKSSYNVEQLLHLFSTSGTEDMVFYEDETHGALLDDYLKYSENSGINIYPEGFYFFNKLLVKRNRQIGLGGGIESGAAAVDCIAVQGEL